MYKILDNSDRDHTVFTIKKQVEPNKDSGGQILNAGKTVPQALSFIYTQIHLIRQYYETKSFTIYIEE